MRDTRTIFNTSASESLEILKKVEQIKEEKGARFKRVPVSTLTYKCKGCEKSFNPTREWQTFCNKKCKVTFHNNEAGESLVREVVKGRQLEIEIEVKDRLIEKLEAEIQRLRKQ